MAGVQGVVISSPNRVVEGSGAVTSTGRAPRRVCAQGAAQVPPRGYHAAMVATASKDAHGRRVCRDGSRSVGVGLADVLEH